MNSQEIYKEVINIPEVVSYITKDPFKYEIVPFDDRWGTGINTTIIAERNIDPTFMKYDHDVMQISVQRSEHMPSYKISMPYPEFFIYENESIDAKTPLFYMGTFLSTYTIMNDDSNGKFFKTKKEIDAIFNFDIFNYFETLKNEEAHIRMIKTFEYIAHHPFIKEKRIEPEYLNYMRLKIIQFKERIGMPISFKEYAWKI